MASGKMFQSVKQLLPVGTRGSGLEKTALPPPETISADSETVFTKARQPV